MSSGLLSFYERWVIDHKQKIPRDPKEKAMRKLVYDYNRSGDWRRLLEALGAQLEPGSVAHRQLQDVTACGAELLRYACALGHAELLGALLAAGLRPNDAVDARGNTLLHVAARHGDERLARLLLDHGADPRAPNFQGRTPLQCARLAGRAALADMLEGHVASSHGDSLTGSAPGI